MHLYLDTTHGIVLGLIDEKLNWLEYASIDNAKSSAILHSEIHKILNKYEIEPTGLKSLIYCAGPGSYTGMRVSEGLAQIFEMAKIPLYPFYHFEVPYIFNNDSGIWIDHAFKGEIFIYEWNKLENSTSRVASDELNLSQYKNIYSYNNQILDSDVESTSEMIKKNPSILLKKLLTESSLNRELYYYRDLSEEFRRG